MNIKSLAKDTAIYGLSSIIGRFLNYLLVPLYTYKIAAANGGYGIVTNLYAYTALLLAFLIWALVRWIRMRRANRTFMGRPIVKDPPHIVALRALDKIRKQKLWQNDKQKQFFTEVTDALRVYIADRFGIVALERPSREMLSDLKQQAIEEKLYDDMEALFTRADLVKFAKYQASEPECEEVIPSAVRFVNATYMQEIDDEKKEEK